MKNQPNRNYVSNDVVQTPPALCKLIVEHFKPTGRVIEPCSGEGNFVKALNSYIADNFNFHPGDLYTLEKPIISSIFECEISKGIDFLTYVPDKKYDWCITNPPWSKILEFLVHGMEVSNNVVFLFTLNHLYTTARLREITKHGFGIKEQVFLDWPMEWHKSGFQLGAVYLKKNYKGKCKISDFRNLG